MDRLGIRVRPRLGFGLGDGVVYPVTLVVSATATRRNGSERRRFYQRRIEIGLQSLEKIMAKSPSAVVPAAPAVVAPPPHPDADYAIVTVGLGMKFPDVFPRDYAMCEVRLDVSFVAPRHDVIGAAKDMHQRIGPYVQQTLGEIARAAGGTPPFVESTNAAAAQGAEVKPQ